MNTRKLAVIGILSLLLSVSNLTFGGIVHASGVSQASFTTTWYDNHVTNIRVNSVRNSVQVFYDDNNIVSNGNCDDHRTWTAATGWTEDGHDFACIGDQNANSGDSSTYAHYTNANFPLCGGVPTYVYYDRNHAFATPNGTSGYIDSTAASGCLISTAFYNQMVFEPGVYY